MPAKSVDEILDLLADEEVFAVALDTSALRQHGYRFDEKPVSSLGQLPNHNIRVIFSYITLREVKKHLIHDAVDVAQRHANIKKEFHKKWKRPLEQASEDTAAIKAAAIEMADQAWGDFIDAVEGEIVGVDGADLASQVIDRYFEAKPPFKADGPKKEEFPDAFALLRLSALAEAENKFLVIVSNDSDWKNFCQEDPWLVHVENISKCLDLFNRSDKGIALAIIERLRAGGEDPLYVTVFDQVSFQLNDVEFDVDAYSSFRYEMESAYVSFIEFENFGEPSVVESDDDSISIQVNAQVLCRLSAEFSFYQYDSIDKDEFLIGNSSLEFTDSIRIGLSITLGREEENVDPETLDLKVHWREPTISLGEIEPDWGNDSLDDSVVED